MLLTNNNNKEITEGLELDVQLLGVLHAEVAVLVGLAQLGVAEALLGGLKSTIV